MIISWRAIIAIVTAALVLTFLHSCFEDDAPEQVLLDLAQRRLDDLNSDYNPMDMSQRYNLDIGTAADIYLPNYTARLEATSKRILSPWYMPGCFPSISRTIDMTLDALSFHQEQPFLTYENRSLGPTLDHTIFTVSKNMTQVVEAYNSWAVYNPDWRFAFHNDETMEDWIRSYMPGSELQSVYHSFPRPVMRSDLFRYMLIWQHGGL